MSIIHGLSIIANGAFILKSGHVKKTIDLQYDRIFYNDSIISLNDYKWIPTMNPFSVIPHKHISSHLITVKSFFDTIQASVKYEPIREILFQVGSFIEIPNINRNFSIWTILYGITDTVFYYMNQKFSLSKKESINELGLEYSELKRFSGTANNFDFLGIYARHGKQNWNIPKNPMSLEESYSFAFNLANKFIIYYHSKVNEI